MTRTHLARACAIAGTAVLALSAWAVSGVRTNSTTQPAAVAKPVASAATTTERARNDVYTNTAVAARYAIAQALLPSAAGADPLQVEPRVPRAAGTPCVQTIMLGAFANIHLVAPDEYLDFAYLADAAYLVLAVSGDVAAEAAPLGKPVLLLNSGTDPTGAVPLTSETPNIRRIDVHEQTISDVVLNLISDRYAWELLRNPEQPRVDA